jgi:hypothetical protein
MALVASGKRRVGPKSGCRVHDMDFLLSASLVLKQVELEV